MAERPKLDDSIKVRRFPGKTLREKALAMEKAERKAKRAKEAKRLKRSTGLSPRKSSQFELENRRKQVLALRMRGLGLRAIAKELKVGHMTIKRDLDALRDEMQKRLSKIDKNHIIANSVSVYEEIEKNAWEQFHKVDEKTRPQYLNIVRAARNDQVKLLTDLGMITKAPQEVKHTVESSIISKWTPEAQDMLALAILKAELTPALPPVPEGKQVIEAKSKPSKS